MRSSIVALLSLAMAPFATCEMTADSTGQAMKHEVVIDLGKMPLHNAWNTEWKQDVILRIGLGTKSGESVKFHLYGEYQHQHSGPTRGDMNPLRFEKEYPRHLYGIGLTMTLWDWFVLGATSSVARHGEMEYWTYRFGSSDTLRGKSTAASETLSFLYAGVKHDFSLSDDVSLPVGVYFPLPLTPDLEFGHLLFSLFAATIRVGLLLRY